MLTTQQIKEIYDSGPFSINGVGFGYKRINNYLSDKRCVVFHVESKYKPEDLMRAETLPSTINIGGDEYIVDVVESRDARVAGCNDPNSEVVRSLQTDQRHIAGGLSITSTYKCGVPSDMMDNNHFIDKSSGTFAGIFFVAMPFF